MCRPKSPLDSFPYERDPRSRALGAGVEDGNYIYVQDIDGTIYILPDESHMHPKVLGNASPAIYAGDLRVERRRIVDVTNLSGTFQFDDPHGLLSVATQLAVLGFIINEGAVRFFPMDGSPPCILR
ncbi:MAG TPA: hypothetical protein VK395_36765 [Gemmataceae bacterium]|nr:hypothetical protein [Gemmataceae bacterium]